MHDERRALCSNNTCAFLTFFFSCKACLPWSKRAKATRRDKTSCVLLGRVRESEAKEILRLG